MRSSPRCARPRRQCPQRRCRLPVCHCRRRRRCRYYDADCPVTAPSAASSPTATLATAARDAAGRAHGRASNAATAPPPSASDASVAIASSSGTTIAIAAAAVAAASRHLCRFCHQGCRRLCATSRDSAPPHYREWGRTLAHLDCASSLTRRTCTVASSVVACILRRLWRLARWYGSLCLLLGDDRQLGGALCKPHGPAAREGDDYIIDDGSRRSLVCAADAESRRARACPLHALTRRCGVSSRLHMGRAATARVAPRVAA